VDEHSDRFGEVGDIRQNAMRRDQFVELGSALVAQAPQLLYRVPLITHRLEVVDRVVMRELARDELNRYVFGFRTRAASGAVSLIQRGRLVDLRLVERDLDRRAANFERKLRATLRLFVPNRDCRAVGEHALDVTRTHAAGTDDLAHAAQVVLAETREQAAADDRRTGVTGDRLQVGGIDQVRTAESTQPRLDVRGRHRKRRGLRVVLGVINGVAGIRLCA